MTLFTLGADTFSATPLLRETFSDLQRWIALEGHGRWTPGPDGLTAEWLEKSPSLFLKQRIDGDFLWRTRLSRIAPDEEFLKRFHASPHAQGADPQAFYNFNFWLRADAPEGSGEEFIEAYPRYLGTGWNGMGDDHWRSLFTTVVRNEAATPRDWVRLRRSPGYEKMRDIQGVVPHLPYGQAHWFSFAVQGSRVRMYFDETRVYDCDVGSGHPSGYIGVCIWLCTVRFHEMELFRV